MAVCDPKHIKAKQRQHTISHVLGPVEEKCTGENRHKAAHLCDYLCWVLPIPVLQWAHNIIMITKKHECSVAKLLIILALKQKEIYRPWLRCQISYKLVQWHFKKLDINKSNHSLNQVIGQQDTIKTYNQRMIVMKNKSSKLGKLLCEKCDRAIDC